MEIIVSLNKFLKRVAIQEPSAPEGFFPVRSLNRKFPWSDTKEYMTPFMWPFPITPTTLLLLFTALLLFSDQARYYNYSCNYRIRQNNLYCKLSKASLILTVSRSCMSGCSSDGYE